MYSWTAIMAMPNPGGFSSLIDLLSFFVARDES
jgi:hypothetical protein